MQKVESSLPYRLQSTKRGNFAESHTHESAESALPSPSNSLVSFRKKGCTPPTLPPTTFKCVPKKQPPSLLGGVPRFSVSSKKSAGGTSAPLIPDFLHHETGEFWVLSHDSKLDSTQSVESKKSFCYFLLLQKVESFLPLKTQIHQRFYNSAEPRIQTCRIHPAESTSQNPPRRIHPAESTSQILQFHPRFCEAESKKVFATFCFCQK